MTIELLNKRLSELNPFRKQLESQIFMIDGHIQEINYLLSELQKPKPEPVQEEQSNGEVIEQAESEAA